MRHGSDMHVWPLVYTVVSCNYLRMMWGTVCSSKELGEGSYCGLPEVHLRWLCPPSGHPYCRHTHHTHMYTHTHAHAVALKVALCDDCLCNDVDALCDDVNALCDGVDALCDSVDGTPTDLSTCANMCRGCGPRVEQLAKCLLSKANWWRP